MKEREVIINGLGSLKKNGRSRVEDLPGGTGFWEKGLSFARRVKRNGCNER